MRREIEGRGESRVRREKEDRRGESRVRREREDRRKGREQGKKGDRR